MRTAFALPFALAAAVSLAQTPKPAPKPAPLTPKLSDEQIDSFLELGKEANSKYEAKDYAACVDVYKKQAAIFARNEESIYNMACCLSLAGKKEEALQALRDAVEAGFTDRAHMEEDTDLDPIRGEDGFKAILERADARGKEIEEADPLAGSAEPGGPYADLDAIDTHFETERKKAPRLMRVLGQVQGTALRQEIARSHGAALEAYGKKHPKEAEEAEFRALVAMADAEPASPTLGKAADAFVAGHGASAHMPKALLIQAEAHHPRLGPSTGEDDYDATLDAMVKVARDVVAKYPDSKDSRDAYMWLVSDATRRGAVDEGLGHYRRLQKGWPDDKAFWSRNEYGLVGYRLMDKGPIEFDVKGTNGEPLSIERYKGKVLLLDFWATWCLPCRGELPHLRDAYSKYHDKGFEIIGISADESEESEHPGVTLEAFKEWCLENKLPWPEFYDGKGFKNEIVDLYGVKSIPTTFLLDRLGKVRAAQLRGEDLGKKVAELLAEQAP